MTQITKVLSTELITRDVIRFVLEKPEGINFQPGQATRVSINKPGWENKKRPFTFTSLPEDDHLEFVIKTYPSHQGVTNELLSVKAGDELILDNIFGKIAYKGEGVFIAGGAGVTPFISIFKHLEKDGKIGGNKLIFANKTHHDIILEEKFKKLLGENFVNVLSAEDYPPYKHGYITAEIISKNRDDNDGYVYLCGPKPMMESMEKHFETLRIDKELIVKEVF